MELLFLLLLLPPRVFTAAAQASPFKIDTAGAGARPFDGVGGLSGGGATSKLLPTYPAKQRGEILDALFLPNHLASLSLLKIEIGGDTDSTEGSESSHMHSEEDLDCARGYEFCLAAQAKLRNPHIRIYGLPWGFPHWLAPTPSKPGSGNALSEANAAKTVKYIANWVSCAHSHWNLTIDFLGPWNEKDAQFAESGMSYLKALRSELDSRDFRGTRLVAGDVHSWIDPLCDVLVNKTDPALDAAVAVIGKHYPSTVSGEAAKLTGKPLWASEDYAANSQGAGGRCEARILNQNWVNGLMTATVAWNLITSYYSWTGLGDARTNTGDGLMTANTPWSGSVFLPQLTVSKYMMYISQGGVQSLLRRPAAVLCRAHDAVRDPGNDHARQQFRLWISERGRQLRDVHRPAYWRRGGMDSAATTTKRRGRHSGTVFPGAREGKPGQGPLLLLVDSPLLSGGRDRPLSTVGGAIEDHGRQHAQRMAQQLRHQLVLPEGQRRPDQREWRLQCRRRSRRAGHADKHGWSA